MKKITQKTYIALGLLGTIASVSVIGITSASAADISATTTQSKVGMHVRGAMKGTGLVGTITSINGTTLTVTNKAGTVYTVNATSGTVKKDGVTSTLSALAVGNTVYIRGTTTGTNVVATSVSTGTMPNKGMEGGDWKGKGVAGTVTAVSGTNITLKDKANTVYTVDATNAKVMKNGATGTVSSVAVGDTIFVGGTVTGTSVVATTVMDGIPAGKEMTARGPSVTGTVASVSGNTITVTGKNATVYTVDGTNAKVMKSTGEEKPTESTLASVLTGDTVHIQGTITGTSVVATSIFDGVMPQKTAHVRTAATTSTQSSQ